VKVLDEDDGCAIGDEIVHEFDPRVAQPVPHLEWMEMTACFHPESEAERLSSAKAAPDRLC
jgi:hypothetical protein